MRGAPGTNHELLSGEGLIPARAGSTSTGAPEVPAKGAHPRPCGEHQPWGICCPQKWGSSPPVRGALCSERAASMAYGLIPARAGSTGAGVCSLTVSRAHPRPCGEHVEWADARKKKPGSSPPVRGALVGNLKVLGLLGLIPARAGSTKVPHPY